MKKTLSVILLVVLCLSLASCAVTKKDLVGTWTGSWTYEGNAIERTIVLEDDGTYRSTIYQNGSFAKAESGVYEIDGNSISLHETGEMGYSVFDYKGGKLVNGDHKFVKD